MADQELYHSDLLAYAREHPMMHEKHQAAHVVKAYSPLCGDKFEIRFDLNGVFSGVSFFGYGCIVSTASTGLLAEILTGKSPMEARQLMQDYLDALRDSGNRVSDDPRFTQLMVARKYPGRIQCAALAWEVCLDHTLFGG